MLVNDFQVWPLQTETQDGMCVNRHPINLIFLRIYSLLLEYINIANIDMMKSNLYFI